MSDLLARRRSLVAAISASGALQPPVVEFRNHQRTVSSATSFDVNFGSVVSDGKLMIVCIGGTTGSQNFGAPSGWVSLGSIAPSTTPSTNVFYKIADNESSSIYTFTKNSGSTGRVINHFIISNWSDIENIRNKELDNTQLGVFNIASTNFNVPKNSLVICFIQYSTTQNNSVFATFTNRIPTGSTTYGVSAERVFTSAISGFNEEVTENEGFRNIRVLLIRGK
jgi:hypothetical protein